MWFYSYETRTIDFVFFHVLDVPLSFISLNLVLPALIGRIWPTSAIPLRQVHDLSSCKFSTIKNYFWRGFSEKKSHFGLFRGQREKY